MDIDQWLSKFEVIAADEILTVKLQPLGDSSTGRVFSIRLMKTE